MDEGKFEETVSTWKEKLRNAYEDYKKKQDEMNAKIRWFFFFFIACH